MELPKLSLSADTRAAEQPFSRVEAAPPAATRAVAIPQPATPHLPSAVGWLMLLAYAALMGAFLLFFGGSGSTAFVIVIGFFFLAVYAAVPFVFLRLQARNPDQATWTAGADRPRRSRVAQLAKRAPREMAAQSPRA